MPIRETGKRRAQRIPLDYYKRPDAMLRGKLIFTAVAAIAAASWWASGLEFRDGSIRTSPAGLLRYSKGPVARVHEAWESKCDACHRPFSTMDDSRWSPPGLVSKSTSDHLCQTCHQGPPHHPAQRAEDVKSCAGCHVDHRGRDASLVILNDRECTSCHGDLGNHIVAAKKDARPIAESIHSFNGDHPPFSTEGPSAKDPGRLRFNHALHLNPGLAKTVGDRSTKTLEWLKTPADRERYRLKGQPDTAPIQLDCASCHVTDPGDTASVGGRSSGSLMLPIRYENQCAACHPLTFDPQMPGRSVPHGQQPAALRTFLEDVYAGRMIKADSKLQARPVPSRTLPGRKPDEAEVASQTALNRSVALAEKTLYTGRETCLECHVTGPSPESTTAGMPPAILPPNVPDIWLKNANFDHAAHRAVDCKACHAQATKSSASDDILIPGIASCRECHAPSSVKPETGMTVGGVRHDCTECHRYHNADHPNQGRGARAERGVGERTIDEFLRGLAPASPPDGSR